MEEIITVNGMAYKASSSVPLTMEQRNDIIKQISDTQSISNMSNRTILALANLAGVTVNIYILGSTTVYWTGTTNTSGIAVDAAGLKPSLPYNDYKITATKYGYTSSEATFNIPADAAKTIRIIIINNQITITITD